MLLRRRTALLIVTRDAYVKTSLRRTSSVSGHADPCHMYLHPLFSNNAAIRWSRQESKLHNAGHVRVLTLL